MSANPLVSVIVPAYDVAPYIGAALESVFAQTYSPYEVLVVNDGSSDTPALETALAPYRARITYLTQPNLGAGVARNRAIAAARGTLLAFLDGDDLWEPGLLASQVAFLQQGGYDMVYADSRLFGEVAQPGRTCMENAPPRGAADLEGLLSLRCQPITSTTVVVKQRVVEAGLFDESIRRGQDYDLWVRLALRGARIGYQRDVLGSYRVRSDSLSSKDDIRLIDRELNVFQTLRDKLKLPEAAQALIDGQLRRLSAAREVALAKRELVARNYAAASGHLQAAWRVQPDLKLLAFRLALPLAPALLRAAYLKRHAP